MIEAVAGGDQVTDAIDPVKSIEKIYHEEMREIPYPVFMKCFDRLFVETPHSAAPPAAELKKYFRAVCMAVERGIADYERRGADRVKEFYETVYPVWKDGMPEGEFREFQNILDGSGEGTSRQREIGAQPDIIGGGEGIDYECEGGYPDEVHRKFERAFRSALEAEGRKAGGGEEGRGGDSEDGERAEAQPRSAGVTGEDVPVFSSAKHLSEAVSAGKVALSYTDMSHKTPLAAYRHEDTQVMVRLVQSARAYYLSLTYPAGYAGREDADQRMIAVTSRLGYTEVKDCEYQLKGRNYSLNLLFGARATYLACRTGIGLSPQSFEKALSELDRHLQEIVEEFRVKKGNGGA